MSQRCSYLIRFSMLAGYLFSVAVPMGGAQVQPGTTITAAPADPSIAGALRQISSTLVRGDIEKLVSFGNRSTISSMETGLPAGSGVTAAADWVFAEFSRISAACNNCLTVKRDDFVEPAGTNPGSRIPRPTRIQNIYAILPGTDPAQAARMVLVTGHYDSRNSDTMDTHSPAPGANDDASGVAVSLECARVLSKLKFPSTIIFVAVAGEEQGLNGSRHLAQLARSEGWQLEAVLNSDIVGGDTTPGEPGEDKTAVRIFSEGVPGPATMDQLHQLQTLGAESDSPSRELARAIAEVDHTYFKPGQTRATSSARHIPAVASFHPILVFRRDRYLRGGDHTSFNLEGFAAVRFTEWRENFNHQHQNPRSEKGVQFGDLLQFVDFDYVANVARLNAATLATFASAPGIPLNVHILTRELDNNTELTWEAPHGAPAKTTYEVEWRDTDSPTWTTVVSAGSALSIKLPISKDNVIFGVRSVDPAGHRSMAVYPMPTRPNTGVVAPIPQVTTPH